MKVLVVDDDVVSRMVLMHLIDSCGVHDIVEAEDGAAAWEQLEAGLRPALCFCDLRMPRLSGMELLQRVKGNPELQAMPFVLISSATDRDTVDGASAAGADGYIVKPFQGDEVRPFLQRMRAPAIAWAAEPPGQTRVRLGVGAERLQAYLKGFEAQLAALSGEIGSLAVGDAGALRVQLERLHVGCATLGLSGAAEAVQTALIDTPDAPALHALLAQLRQAVLWQEELLVQDSSLQASGLQ
ncbi:response regulator [Janthinobacterium sp.]|uniref:response regulator n=1 Tax=Janthinobacterium sp. TaxID=1871054 RepID=UPI0026029068|nr:response regulator [Janthinobacterium sp.]